MMTFFLCLAVIALLCMVFPGSARGESLQAVHAALFSLPLPVVAFDAADLRIDSLNPPAAALLDAAPSAHVGDLGPHTGELTVYLQSVIAAVRSQQNTEQQLTIQSDGIYMLLPGKHGRPFPLQVRVFMVTHSPGGPLLLFAIFEAAAGLCLTENRYTAPSGNVAYTKDLYGRLIDCNQAFEQLARKNLSGVFGKTVAQAGIEQPFAGLFTAHDSEIDRTQQPVFSRIRCTDPQGHNLSYDSYSYPVCTHAGEPAGMYTTLQETAHNSVTVATLARQEELLQTAYEIIQQLLADDGEIDYLAVNVLKRISAAVGADLADVWRYHDNSEEDLVCIPVHRWSSLGPMTALTRYDKTMNYTEELPLWASCLSRGQSINSLTRNLTAKEQKYLAGQKLGAVLAVPIIFRSRFWGFIRLAVATPDHHWSRGEEAIIKAIGLFLAVTMERRTIQAALKESEQRFRDVSMAAGEIIWEINAAGYFSYISKRVEEVTGYAVADILGSRFEDYANDESGAELTGRMFQQCINKGFFRGMKHRFRCKDGSFIFFLTSGRLLSDGEGFSGICGTSLDITTEVQITDNLNTTLQALESANSELEASVQNARALTQKAETASKAKSEFIANISHEIRTPLNSIIGMAYLTKQTSLTKKQKEYLDKISSAGSSLLEIIDEILDYSRIESGILQITPRPFQLVELIEKLASIMGPKAEEKNLHFTLYVAHNIPGTIVSDPVRLLQVLSNLVSNAVKFTEQGHVAVACTLSGRAGDKLFLRCSITDTGIGMSEEVQTALFTPFQQGEGSSTRKFGGLGLGLSVAKSILDILEASLSIESEPGRGTSIYIDLAVEEEADEFAGLQTNILENKDVLVLHPDESMRRALHCIVADFGCIPHAFDDISTALVSLETQDTTASPYALMLLPYQIATERDGRHLKHLRNNMHLENPPRIVALVPLHSQETDLPDVDSIVLTPVVGSKLYEAFCSTLAGEKPGGRGAEPSADESEGFYQSNPAQAGQEPEEEEDWTVPDLPDLHAEEAVERLGDNPHLYKKLLADFCTHHASAGKELTLALDEKRHKDALRIAKTIRTLSVTIGAVAVQSAADVLVTALEGKEAPQNTDTACAAFDTAVTSLVSALQDALPKSGSRSSVAGMGLQELAAKLETLLRLLQEDDADARDIFVQLEPSLRQYDQPKIMAVSKAMAVFEFGQALEILQPLALMLIEKSKQQADS